MMKQWFSADSTVDHSIFTKAKHRYSYTLELPVAAEQVWEGLSGDRPLHWCGALRGRFTSDPPHRVGTTREVRVAGVLVLRERFFFWDEVGRHHSFVVEQTNLPLFRVFAEDYAITSTDAGCQLRWCFAMEFKNHVLASSAPLNKRILLDRLIRDTAKHFGGRISRTDHG